MNRPLQIGLILWTVATGTGCAKDVDQFIPAQVADSTWVQQIQAGDAVAQLGDSLRILPATGSVDLSISDTVMVGGASYGLPLQTWTTPTGIPYSGKALLQGLLLQKPGELIRDFVSTNYLNSVIYPSGAVYWNVAWGDSNLTPSTEVQVTFPSPNAPSGNGLYAGTYDNAFLSWRSLLSGAAAETSLFVNGSSEPALAYSTLSAGWLLSGSLTTTSTTANIQQIVVALPNLFSNDNSAVFCVLEPSQAVLALKGDYASKTFMAANLTNMPIGATAILISLTYTGTSFYLGVQSITIQAGTYTTTLMPGLESLPDIIQYLEQL